MNQKPNILVVCHDAGGAELVAAYVAAQSAANVFFCFVAGPAVNIFKRYGILATTILENKSIDKIFLQYPNISRVITGSSWSTTLELDVISLAKKRNIPTVLFLDHWINYKERFGFPAPEWENRLPDEIVVGDDYALKMAKKNFPNKKITLEPNHYFDYLKEKIKPLQVLFPEERNTILWISEPFSQPINAFGDTAKNSITEYDILNDLIQIIINDKRLIKFKIRLHPSEPLDKYLGLLKQNTFNVPCTISTEPELLADISQAHYIIGIESMALVVAMLVGKSVASFVPDLEYNCTLPFPEIKKINSGAELRIFLA